MSRLAFTSLVVAAISVGVAAATPNQVAGRTAAPVLQSYRCVGAQFTLFRNFNNATVQNGGAPPTFSTRGRAYCVVGMATYHWNNGQGKAPGAIGLLVLSGLGGPRNTFGPWLAKGSSGQGGAPNVNWAATVPTAQQTVINGTYACQDPDQASWSQNATTRGRGFCLVLVRRAVRIKPPRTPPPTYQCTGSQLTLFNNWNVFGVLNGGQPPTFTTNGRSYCVSSISDFHWNNGQGKAPGTIGLRVIQGLGGAGATLGPWPATGSSGQGGARNVNWTASPPGTVVINGTDQCLDSDRASWSQNPNSRGLGFCNVVARPAVLSIGGAPIPPAPPPPGGPPTGGGHPNCTPTPPSSFLIYPNHASAGSTTSFLLWCQRPVSLGFQGAFAPLGVLIYDWASFNNQHFVQGYLVPNSASQPVRPPIIPFYTVVGPNDIDVVLPASMLRGVYVPLVVWLKGEVPSQNLLNVP